MTRVVKTHGRLRTARTAGIDRLPGMLAEMPEGTRVLAVDLGATNIRTAVVDRSGQVRHRHRAATDPDDPVRALLGTLRRTQDDQSRDGGPAPVAVAVGALGPLDSTRHGIELDSTLLPGTGLLDLVGPLREATSLPVKLERDTTVGALGEAAFGAAQGCRDFIYVTVSSGVGSAVIYNGRLLSGAHDLAGEIGHISLDLDGPPCGCGQRGCLEVLTSGSGIAAADGRDASTVARAARAGDERAAAILARARRAFAVAMTGLVNAFDPALIVVGGSVAEGEGDALLEPAREAVRRWGYAARARQTPIVPAALGDDAGLAGGIALLA